MKMNFIIPVLLSWVGFALMIAFGHAEEKAKTDKKQAAVPEFIRVEISRFVKPNANFDPPDPDFPDTLRVITDPKEIAKLAALFPGMEKGKVDSPKYADEPCLYQVRFLRPNIERLSNKHPTVLIDKKFQSWSRGDGYHKLAKPEEARKTLDYYCDTYKPDNHFVKATVLHFYEPKGFENTGKKYMEKEAVITDRKQLKRLLSYLPGVGEGHDRLIRGAWVWRYIITLEREGKQPIEVVVKPDCNVWSEGLGDNVVAKPEEFKKFLNDVVKDAKEKPLRELKRRD